MSPAAGSWQNAVPITYQPDCTLMCSICVPNISLACLPHDASIFSHQHWNVLPSHFPFILQRYYPLPRYSNPKCDELRIRSRRFSGGWQACAGRVPCLCRRPRAVPEFLTGDFITPCCVWKSRRPTPQPGTCIKSKRHG